MQLMEFNMEDKIQFIFTLLVIYQLKHYIADFPLQREYMLRKTEASWDFLAPLSLHCLVHGIGTLVICLIFAPALYWLAILDFVIHFIIDRIKAGPRYLGRFNDLSKPSFWNILGLDQMAHHLTHIGLIYIIVNF
jgi:hypothetical protein